MQHIGTFNSVRWGKVIATRGTYQYKSGSGPTAIALVTESGEPLATLSVNMYRPECSRDSRDLPSGCFYAKHWGENAGLAQEALESGIFVQRDDLPEARSGCVSAPVWQIKSEV